MKAQDYPVRPEMRLVESHKLPEFCAYLFEQPEIAVDEPYFVVVQCGEASIRSGVQPFGTKVEAQIYLRSVTWDFARIPGNEHLLAELTKIYEMQGSRP